MNGATVYQMISGLGDAFGDAYSSARKEAQEAEAPTLLSNLMTAYRGGATGPTGPSAPAGPSASGAGSPAAAAPAPSFAATGGAMGDYLAQTRARESGGNDAAANPSSTALGRYQFTQGTWAGLAKKYPDLGLTPNGRIDPAQQERAMQAFTRDNAEALSAAGLPINPANLYGAHFLGAGGATRFIPGALNSPDAPATQFADAAAVRANRTVFFNKDGTPKTAGQVYSWMGGARGGAEPAQLQQVASAGLADAPAAGAQPIGFTVPEGGAAAPSQAFPGFGANGGGAQMTPQVREALNAAWRNPATRGVAAQVFGQLLKGQDNGWELKDVNGQSAWVNGRDGRILPIGQAKRNTATVGNSLVDTATGEVLYSAPDRPTAVSPGTSLVGADGRVIYQAPDRENARLQTIAPGSVVFDPVSREPVYTAPRAERSEGDKVREQVAAREKEAERLGLPAGSPTAQTYALTGKIGRDQELSATDKKAIQEAEEDVLSAQTAIESLNQAKAISPKAYTGPTAGPRGYAMSLVGSDAGEATQDLANIVTTNTLGQLKAIFGGMPTEGERKILLDIQGSVNQSDAVRQKIFDRGIALAQRRLEFNRRRAEDLKGGFFYKAENEARPDAPKALPKGEARTTIPGGKSAASAISEARAFVKANPGAKAQVEERLRSWGIDPARLGE